ncbi:TPA: hypothetical protein P1M42_000108 [Clostridioides difficile]|uniref:Uncharacterized protein n=1 Tax=Clostridioides difficile ATCC 9689 = DSM 1296 TaxID=1121308 RepID=A0ACA7UNT0_CLODI|nr:hypothetical protein [Clostridioides difficile]YP_009221691.1 hypothetical protein PHICD211_20090 [Clostridium phage phiCD211]AKP44768.1 hypothetical protein CDIF1296T_phi094 [Peptoclostridium phage phiCDIF1296T]WMU95191.1 hypothetical protein ADOKEBJH_00095 [Clostridioides phage AR1086-1]CCL67072.1 hypothetical protein BN183_3830015 [Clostridioides difficile E7]EIJ0743045.1 hypothetical protein [Clostridioides difficile]EIS9446844.1 hypothetical protein [Clostridioides difficile]
MNKGIKNYITAVNYLLDNLEYMMEDDEFNNEKLQKRIDVIRKFEREL